MSQKQSRKQRQWFPKRLEHWLIENEDVSLSAFLIALCLLTFVAGPFVHSIGASDVWVTWAFSILFLLAAFTGGLQGLWRDTAFGLATLSIIGAWIREHTESPMWIAISLATAIVFMAFVCFQLNVEVFRPGEINGHRIRGAVAIYLVIGFIFGLVYGLLEVLQPGSFQGLGPDGFGLGLEKSMYFSFVTLTTLGFGDITPLGRIAQNLVVIETIIGQLYLAVLLGRLVSLHKPAE